MLIQRKISILTVTVFVAFISIYKKRCLQSQIKKEKTRLEEGLKQKILIEKGKEFKGTGDPEKETYVEWSETSKHEWKFRDGGYFVLENRVILPTTPKCSKNIKPSEKYNWIPCVKDCGVTLFTDNTSIIDENKKIICNIKET
jgi:hypothetical protein|tara:strand:+ start:13366 stop:13794 length:429 start_codon:yes stop_codon:yes gene_type:complete